MVLSARRLLAPALVLVGAVYVAWLGFGVQTTGDYPYYFAPSMKGLLAGHVGAFFHLLPTDGAGGSVLLRAPGALVGRVIVGGQLAEFRFGALECLLVLGGLGLWLERDMTARGRPAVARVGVVALSVAVPVLLDAILFGHPEEPLGAALCVASVLFAGAGRSAPAGIALGLAALNKPWGVLALAPALLAAPDGRARVRIAATAAAVAGAWYAATYIGAPGHFSASLSAISPVAHPEELWWPLAHLVTQHGATPYYALPAFVIDHGRQLAVLVAVGLSVGVARRRTRSTEDCLALLALAFLARCLLDPSDHVYYHVPFVVALLAWEARTRGAPVLALLATGLLWLVFHTVSGVEGVNGQFAAYLAAMAPLAVVLGGAVLGRGVRSTAGVVMRNRDYVRIFHRDVFPVRWDRAGSRPGVRDPAAPRPRGRGAG